MKFDERAGLLLVLIIGFWFLSILAELISCFLVGRWEGTSS